MKIKKPHNVVFVIAIIVLVFAGVVCFLKYKNTPVFVIEGYKNTSYVIEGQSVAMVDGYAESSVVPDSASKIVTQYFGNETFGDLNGDGISDVAFILTQSTGGSGTFYYVVAATKNQNGYQGTNAILLGDRIAPQTMQIQNGIIVVNYADRKVSDAMTTAPSVGVSKYLKVSNGQLIETIKPSK